METKILDFHELSQEFGIPVHFGTLPNGRTVGHAEWSKADFARFSQRFDGYRAAADTDYQVTNSPAPWITAATIQGLGRDRVRYLYPDPNGTVLELPTLQKGTVPPAAENCDVQFQITEEGNRIFLNMTSDRVEAREVGHHTFELENLSKFVIPDLPAGRDIFIHAWGMYCVMCSVALSYMDGARSVSIGCHDSDYFCCYSTTADMEVGDVAPRTLDNPLPH